MAQSRCRRQSGIAEVRIGRSRANVDYRLPNFLWIGCILTIARIQRERGRPGNESNGLDVSPAAAFSTCVYVIVMLTSE